MRIIDDETFAETLRLLLQDPKVALFQKLIVSKKAEPAENPDEIKVESEVEK